jgi:hypothetical protein
MINDSMMQKELYMKKIRAWSLNVVWEDGEEDKNIDVPQHIANDIEYYLDQLEEEYADE